MLLINPSDMEARSSRHDVEFSLFNLLTAKTISLVASRRRSRTANLSSAGGVQKGRRCLHSRRLECLSRRRRREGATGGWRLRQLNKRRS